MDTMRDRFAPVVSRLLGQLDSEGFLDTDRGDLEPERYLEYLATPLP